MNEHPVTNVAAAIAIVSPWWLDALANVSQIATLLLPIVGVLWFAVQIYIKVVHKK